MRRPSSSVAAGDEGHKAEPLDESGEDVAELGRDLCVARPRHDGGDGAVDVAEERPGVRGPGEAGDGRDELASPSKMSPSPSMSLLAAIALSLPEPAPRANDGRRFCQVPAARCRYCATREMSDHSDKPREALPGGRPRDARADPYLKSMLLGLIEDSYLHTGTFTQFAAEVIQVIAYAVTVPVAFTEGFLGPTSPSSGWSRTPTGASRSSPRKAPASRT